MSRRSYAWLCAVLVLAAPPVVAAQALDSLADVGAGQAPPEPHAIRLWHGAVALGGLSALMLLDPACRPPAVWAGLPASTNRSHSNVSAAASWPVSRQRMIWP